MHGGGVQILPALFHAISHAGDGFFLRVYA